MRSTSLWIVCPSYSDVQSFCRLRTNVMDVIAGSPEISDLDLRFVLVDDTGGFDQEIRMVEGTPGVRVITPPFNLGHQRALVYGLRLILPDVADSDVIVTMDADGEDRPEDLPRLLAPLFETTGTDGPLCVARRTKRSESFRFKVLYTLYRALFRFLTGTTVRSGNFAAYRGWLARRMLPHPYFDLCYSSTLISLRIEVTPVPCPRGQRYEGRSRMNSQSLFMHGVRMLMPFTDRIAVRALTAFSAMLGLGIAFACLVAGIRIFTHDAIPGWTTYSLLGVLTLSVVALGNFVVLFAVFSHSRGISLANVEEWNGELSSLKP